MTIKSIDLLRGINDTGERENKMKEKIRLYNGKLSVTPTYDLISNECVQGLAKCYLEIVKIKKDTEQNVPV